MRVAVVFVDVTDSVGLFERLGQDAAFAAIEQMQDGLAADATALGGRVIKTLGDGAMIVFDLPQGAVEFGLGVVTPAEGVQIRLRATMCFGPVTESKGDYFGDTVNVSARLLEVARPGQFLTTQESLDAADMGLDLQTRQFGKRQLRGKGQFLEIVELLTEEEDAERTRLAAPTATGIPSVGLEVEHRGTRLRIQSVGPFSPITAGRGEDSTIVLQESDVSRAHLSITRRNGKFYLVDHSSNGTLLAPTGGTPVAIRNEEALLHGSGKIFLGGVNEDESLPALSFRIAAFASDTE